MKTVDPEQFGPGLTPKFDDLPQPVMSARDAYFENIVLGKVALVAGIVLIIVLLVIWRHRRRIASSATDATVAALASGLKAKRKVSAKGSTFRQRIIDRADAP